jgi:hypothetical protein
LIPFDGARSLKRQKPFLSSRANSKTYSHHFPDTDLEDSSGPKAQNAIAQGRKEVQRETAAVDYARLEAKVDGVAERLKELTELIMAQQERRALTS